MFKRFLEKMIGGGTRYSMVILYGIISIVMCYYEVDAGFYAIFSANFIGWLVSQTVRKHDDTNN